MRNLKTILLISVLLVGAAILFTMDKVPCGKSPTLTDNNIYFDATSYNLPWADVPDVRFERPPIPEPIITFNPEMKMLVVAMVVFIAALLFMYRREYEPPERSVRL